MQVGFSVNMNIPRQEYPRPQFERRDWMNLNGLWQFEIDNDASGEARALYKEGVPLCGTINVPFCPESKLSGVEHKDFIKGVWYKRTINIPDTSGKIFIHFGAADYICRIYVNGTFAGEHKGGYISFSFDISFLIRKGENEICVYCSDDTLSPLIPSGKQSDKYESYGCLYTRTTGIWQTVWLEFIPEEYIEWVKYYPNVNDSSITITALLNGTGAFSADIFYDDEPVGSYITNSASGVISFTVKLSRKELWEVGKGRLYDVKFKFGKDDVKSYFGLRSVRIDGKKLLINNKAVFGRWVLDQGFYPDGIYTAPSDEALENDIKLSMAVGFNGARLHEKIFEGRFLYHADRHGYIVWGEYPDWGMDHTNPASVYSILPEWTEEIKRDFNHPAIIGWCPHNETWAPNCPKAERNKTQYDDAILLLYEMTKKLDPTRPCIDTSGGYHVKTDVYCVHDYEQNPAVFKPRYDKLASDGELYDPFPDKESYNGEACFVSEYGGASMSTENGWGYGATPLSEEEFIARFKGLTEALLNNPSMIGLCYTQLTDIEQEQNGLYTYDRKPKFDTEALRKIMSAKAAIEE